METKGVIHSKQVINATYDISTKCYGVIGICRFDAAVKKNYEALPKERAFRGIVVIKRADGTFDVNVYVVLSSSIKLTEALTEAQKVLKYELNKQFSNRCRKVNLFAMSVA